MLFDFYMKLSQAINNPEARNQGDDLITLWVATCRANVKIDHCRGARACYSTPLFRHFPPLRPLTNTYFHLHILPVPTWNGHLCEPVSRVRCATQLRNFRKKKEIQPRTTSSVHERVYTCKCTCPPFFLVPPSINTMSYSNGRYGPNS